MDKKLIDKVKKYIKKGKEQKAYKYIIENGLLEEFSQQLFYNSYNGGYNQKEYEANIALSDFALRVSADSLKEKFGEELTDSLMQIMYNMEQPSQRNVDLFFLMNQPPMTQETASKMKELLSLYSDGNNVVGTHVVGSAIGEKLNNEGVCLTGHKFLANDLSTANTKSKLEKNITFFYDPIELMTSFSRNKGYNDYGKNEENDIMVVSIPKEELDNNNPDIIIKKDKGEYVNPKFIKGFTRVGTKNGEIRGFVDNSKYQQDIEQKVNIGDLTTQRWTEQFKEWYDESRKPKMQKVKEGVVNFFNRVLNKNKKKEIAEKTDNDRSDER